MENPMAYGKANYGVMENPMMKLRASGHGKSCDEITDFYAGPFDDILVSHMIV